MEEIKIYLYRGQHDNSLILFFCKNRKVFFRLIRNKNETVKCVSYTSWDAMPENRLKHQIEVKKIDLYEFIFSDELYRLFNGKVEYDNEITLKEHEKLKEYFVACDGERR